MSVLDRAFIRAFNKGASADNVDVAEPPQVPRDTESAAPDQPGSPAEHLVDAMCGGQVYRIDQAHPAWTDKFPQPHIQVIPVGSGADLSFASPYHEICPPAFPDLAQTDEADQESTDVLPPAAPESEAVSEYEELEEELENVSGELPSDSGQTCAEIEADCDSAPPEVPTQVEPTAPLTTVEPTPAQLEANATASLRNAAALKMPATLQLPDVFQPPDDEAEDRQQADDATTFAADWEVDRFAWPPICEELIEAQSRYFQHVGARLMAATEESDHVIMISGSRRGEGRSTLAMCLARCAAQAGIKVALIDADLHNAQLGTRLGMETPCSWLDAVVAHGSLQEAAVTSVEDNLTLFPLTGNESVDIQPGDGRLIMFVRRISAHHPLVIIDTGPLGPEETHLFESESACPIDTAIVVRDLRSTEEQGALATAERLQLGGIQAVGIAENFRATE